MAAFLPLLYFFLCAIFFTSTNDWRTAAIKSAISFGVVTVLNTEVLALAGAINQAALSVVWGLESVVLAVVVWLRRHRISARAPVPRVRRDQWLAYALVAATIAIALLTLVTAIAAPPNTYDAMTYHMARVAHWAADGTVAFYPTNVVRQLYAPPWSEYAVLQLQVLSGGDHGANLVQWTSSALSMIAASAVARQLNGPAVAQAFSAFVVATLPMGILQASSTQTDFVVAFWLACTVVFALALVAEPSLGAAAWLGAALGLAVFTKGTAYLFAAPLVIGVGVWIVFRLRRRALSIVAVLVVIPAIINAGIAVRNEAAFHDPLGPAEETAMLANQSHGPQALASNLIRDTAVQLGTPVPQVNQFLERGIDRIHRSLLHIDVNDPRTTWPNVTFAVNPASLDEDYAGDPLQAILAAVAVLGALVLWRRNRLLGLYAAGIAVGFVVFAEYLKWQPWHARLELPLLVASAPLVGAFLAPRAGVVPLGVVAAVLLVTGVPWLIDNQNRPLVGFEFGFSPRTLAPGETVFDTPRNDLYFAKSPSLEDAYAQVTVLAGRTGCHEVALWSGANDWEYPLWALAAGDGSTMRVDQVFVENASRAEKTFGGRPCLLVVTGTRKPEVVDVGGVGFQKSWEESGVAVYEPPS